MGLPDGRVDVHPLDRHRRAADRLCLANGQGVLGPPPAPRRSAVRRALAAQLRVADPDHGLAAAAGRALQSLVRIQRRRSISDRRPGAGDPAADRDGVTVVLGGAGSCRTAEPRTGHGPLAAPALPELVGNGAPVEDPAGRQPGARGLLSDGLCVRAHAADHRSGPEPVARLALRHLSRVQRRDGHPGRHCHYPSHGGADAPVFARSRALHRR